jgi:hypothetical protein
MTSTTAQGAETEDSGLMRDAEARARQFLDEGQIESIKVERMAEDIVSLVGELRRHRRTRAAILHALAED